MQNNVSENQVEVGTILLQSLLIDYSLNLIIFNCLCITTYIYIYACDHRPCFRHAFKIDNLKECNSYIVVFDDILIGLLSVDVPFEFGSGFGSFRCAIDLNFVANMIAGETARNNRTFVR